MTNQCRAASVQAAVGEIVFVEAQVMAEFVQEGVADIFKEEFFVALCHVPNVLEVKDDLLGHRRRVQLFRVVRSDKKPERVLFDAISDQFARGFAFVNNRDAFRLLAQGGSEPL